MFNWTVADVTTFSYFVWATVTLGVAVAAFATLIRSFFEPIMPLTRAGKLLVCGIAFGWLGDGLNKAWFGIQRTVGIDHPLYAYMRDHWMVWSFTVFVLIGGVIHFQTLASRNFKHWAWLFILTLAIAVGALLTKPLLI